jgi:uracil-DNA glycosylase family 4
MDDKLREELTAWLEFYRDLGIEDFYRREPGPVDLPASLAAAQTSQPAAAPRPRQVPTLAESPRVAATSLPTKPSEPKPAAPPASAPTVIRPPVPSLSLFEAPPAPRSGPETLAQIQDDLGDCHRCKLAGGRKTIVFGEGSPHAELVFIGEGPGADEDEQGRPFVGRAGKLLDRMIQAIGMKRDEVYICNVVKCRPPGNRTPEKDEVEACSPFLFRQLEALQPRLICCLGAPAVRTVLGIKEGITKIRGQFFNFGSSKALATVHPAYILRNPREERILREDFEKIRDFLKTT